MEGKDSYEGLRVELKAQQSQVQQQANKSDFALEELAIQDPPKGTVSTSVGLSVSSDSCMFHHLDFREPGLAELTNGLEEQPAGHTGKQQETEPGQVGVTAADRQGMRLAIHVATSAFQCNEVPVSCVFVSYWETEDGRRVAKVEASAHNLTTKLKNASMHCEVLCIKQLESVYPQREERREVISRITAYISLEPCMMCAFALNLAGIPRVVFGAANEKFGGVAFEPNLSKVPPRPYEAIVMAAEAVELLKRFYEQGNENLPEALRHRNRKVK